MQHTRKCAHFRHRKLSIIFRASCLPPSGLEETTLESITSMLCNQRTVLEFYRFSARTETTAHPNSSHSSRNSGCFHVCVAWAWNISQVHVPFWASPTAASLTAHSLSPVNYTTLSRAVTIDHWLSRETTWSCSSGGLSTWSQRENLRRPEKHTPGRRIFCP